MNESDNFLYINNSPASLMVNVLDVKYLNANAKPSVSKLTCESKGSLTAAHIKSAKKYKIN